MEPDPAESVPEERQRAFDEHNRHQVLANSSSALVSIREWGWNIRDFVRQVDPDQATFIDQLMLPHFNGRHAVIAGSGPSLKDAPDALLDKSTLIAGVTNTPYLLSRGITPDLILVADSNPKLREYLRGREERLSKTPFVLPVTAPRIWRDDPIGLKTYYYVPALYSEGTLPDYPVNRLMLDMVSPRGYQRPFLLQAGCVANEAMMLLYFLSHQMPIDQVILTGVDFCVGQEITDSRVPIVSAGNEWYPGAALPVRLETELWPIELVGTPRYVTYLDLLYATNCLSLIRDMPWRTFLVDSFPILSSYAPVRSPTAVSEDEPGPFEPSKPDRVIRADELDAFLSVTNPILTKLEDRMISKARVVPE